MAQFNIKNSRIGQINDSGDNIKVAIQHSNRKSLWDHFFAWYGIVGTTVTIGSALLGWYALHVQYGWWFWGTK